MNSFFLLIFSVYVIIKVTYFPLHIVAAVKVFVSHLTVSMLTLFTFMFSNFFKKFLLSNYISDKTSSAFGFFLGREENLRLRDLNTNHLQTDSL